MPVAADSIESEPESLSTHALSRLGNEESLQWPETHNAVVAKAIPWRSVISALIRNAGNSSGLVAGLAQDDREWICDNLRLLETALREVVEFRRHFSYGPHVRHCDGRRRFRPAIIAERFLYLTRFQFEDRAFSAFVSGWQQHQDLSLRELGALKPALQMAVLEELARTISMVFDRHSPGLQIVPLDQSSIPRLITALRDVGEADWETMSDEIGTVEQVLQSDPAAIYARMTGETRAEYRAAVARLARYSKLSERQVAECALFLAQSAAGVIASGSPLGIREAHVGYYLMDAGVSRLRLSIGYRPGWVQSLRNLCRQFPNGFYLVAIELFTLSIIASVLAALPRFSPIVPAFFFLLIPASQAAVELVNALVTTLLPARPLSRLDFSGGIPDQYKTIVAVPALLLSEQEVRHLLDGLEVRYLANRDRNLYFALLTDGPDANQPFDAKEALAGYCARGIRDLNRKYGADGTSPFLLFHRPRTFNSSQNTWMGWERKRGKLLDLSRLLRGREDRFSVKVGDLAVLSQIKYVITLDADTQLPRDAAQRLVGTLAHPLNQAVVDPETNTVVAGYGILQPRVGIGVLAATRSRLASICSGQTGFDIYTRAVSDVYQDLYGEGIFAGKGIFDVDVFEKVLNDRFPCNTLLSHDLIEGAYARAGLVSDIEVIEDYPSHFSAYTRRKHRWVRGDWQISQWLFPRVPDYSGRMVPNPISIVSRWKIFDNLRRSLIDPGLLALLLAGWFWLPGPAWYWTAITVLLLISPACLHTSLQLPKSRSLRELLAALENITYDIGRAILNALVTLTFLPHQALVMVDAIIRTVVRHRITGRRLLEWETAAEAEAGTAVRRPADTYLSWTPWIALGLAVVLAFARPGACIYALPFLLAWAAAPTIARWLSREKTAARIVLTVSQKSLLRTSALHTWRYFADNSGPAENGLVPDNVQEGCGVARRISPTNLGLLLNARQTACEMGYLTLPEFVASTTATFSTMERLPKHRGHFFNWYDTSTLEVLGQPVVSSVDSGNLAASLWALKQGCLVLAERPIFTAALWQGLVDYMRVLAELDPAATGSLQTIARSCRTDAWQWMNQLTDIEDAVGPLLQAAGDDVRLWARALVERVQAIRLLIDNLAPWLRFINDNQVNAIIGDPAACLTKLTLAQVCILADQFRAQLKSESFQVLNEAMLRSAVTAENLENDLRRLSAEADRIVDEMDFQFLYDSRKKLLAVAYDCATGSMDGARYGLLASEARTAAFIAVAKGDIPQEAWLRLGRAQTRSFGHHILLSWTGTMFEYLMPCLWMRHYPRTILEQSARAAVEIQRAYGRKLRLPWGVSESAYSVTDAEGFYQYRAFGLPAIALKRAKMQPRIVAPYACYLALTVQPAAVTRNLKKMWKCGWHGRYGLYESVEFSESGEPTMIRCWMAHHQAMSLMAIANCLCDSPFQRLFHAEPRVQATELLLHEKVPRGMSVRRQHYYKPPVRERAVPCAPGHVSSQTIAS